MSFQYSRCCQLSVLVRCRAVRRVTIDNVEAPVLASVFRVIVTLCLEIATQKLANAK